MKWYYAKDGQPCGPVEEEEFARLAAAGEVTATTLVWRSGLGDWKPFAEVRPPEPDPAPAPPLAVEPEPPEPKPEHSDLAVPPVDAEEVRLPYAGFWIRVAAMFFDCLILLPVVTVLYFSFIVAFPDFLTRSSAGARASTLFELAVLVLAGAYQTFFVGRFAATPGKMVCNLRVTSADGSRISYGRALRRYLCEGLSSLFFCAGFVLAALNRQKCALHDFLCDTRVIHAE